MSNIIFKNIQKSFGKIHVVKKVDLEIKAKEFFVILGPSGCGKSTLLRIVAGLEQPSSGELHLGGIDITYTTPQHRNVAMVFQNYSLYPHMTVAKNIGYPLIIARRSKLEISERVKAIAETVEITHLLDRYPGQLSGGQRQRVALARAIIRKPDAFLMDEPLSNLDALLRANMRGQLKKLHRRLEITTVFVTHDQIEAMTLADRIMIMNKGVVQQLDTPKNIYERPANCFVANFIGSPPMNLIHGVLKEDMFTVKGVSVPLKKETLPEKIILGIRPEDIDVGSKEDHHLQGEVFNYEYLGEHVEVTILINSLPVIARLSITHQFDIDDNIYLKFNLDKLHLFDKFTEERLG